MFSVEFLEAKGFSLRPFPDGKWWIYKAHDELFIHLSEDRKEATIYDNGWVEDNLTAEEVLIALDQMENGTFEELE